MWQERDLMIPSRAETSEPRRLVVFKNDRHSDTGESH